MATKVFGRNKSTLLAKTGSTSLGGGHDSHLPVGTSGSYSLRGAVQFNLDWTDVTTIVSAVLTMQNTTFTHVDVGGTITIRRITSGSWTPNTARSSLDSPGGSGWSTSGDATYDDIGAGTSSGEVDKNTPNGEGDVWTADITDIVKAWAPASIPGGGGAANYGIVLINSSGTSEMKSGYDNADPYITLTYTSNTVPSAPTLTAPAAGAVVTTTPTFTFTHVDSDSDPLLDWDLQIVDGDEGSPAVWGLAEVNLAAQTTGITGNNVSRTASDLSFTPQRGHTYFWRVRTSASTGELGEGAWTSGAATFTVASLPVSAVIQPTASTTAKLAYTAGDNTTPKLVVGWSYSDADSHVQQSVDIKVYSDAAGSPGAQFGTTYTYTGVATEVTVPLANVTPAEGSKYHISVTPTCSFSQVGAESTKVITRTRWGRGSYYYNNTGTQWTGFSVPAYNVTGTDATHQVVVEYALTANTTEPTTWYSTVADAILAGTISTNDYIWHRVTIFAWNSATPTIPTVTDLAFTWSSVALVPDNWTLDAQSTIDESTAFYGTQALKIAGDSTINTAYQTLTGLVVGQTYIMQGRIKSTGDSQGVIKVLTGDGVTELATTDEVHATADWARYISDTFVAQASSVRVSCEMEGGAGTAAWFDALKLEQSEVANPWTPGFVGAGVVIDAGTLQVDNTAGGVFRLRDKDSNVISLTSSDSGLKGIPVASTSAPSDPFDGMLWWDTDDATVGVGSTSGSGTSFPVGPASGDKFYRTDISGGMLFVFDGTRWLSDQIFINYSGAEAFSATYQLTLTASRTQTGRYTFTDGVGTDIWLIDWTTHVFVAAGGSALSASHKWVAQLFKQDTADATTLLATATWDSGASSIHRPQTIAIGALLGTAATYPAGRIDWTKTGTPGDAASVMAFPNKIRYRIVQT